MKTTRHAPSIVLLYCLTNGVTTVINTNAVSILAGSELNTHDLAMTPDGQSVAFVGNAYGSSYAYETSCLQVWNALTTNTLTLGGVNPSLNPFTNSIYGWPALTPDGHFVAFLSSGPNLVSAPVGFGFHLYVYNLWTGVTQLVDADTNGVGSTLRLLASPRLSDDGSQVAFDSPDGALVPNDNNQAYDVFVRNMTNSSTELISAHAPSLPSLTPNGSSVLWGADVSTNGRYVTFTSEAANLTPGDTNGLRDVFVYDLVGGTNSLVSVTTNGLYSANGLSSEPVISGNGRYVAFSSSANNLVTNVTSNYRNVFVRDLSAGQTKLVSVTVNGKGSGNTNSFTPAISADGRYVLFYSTAGNLVSAAIGNPSENLFCRDTQAGVTYALTANAASSTANSLTAALTASGQYVAYSQVNSGSSVSTLYVWSTAAAQNSYTNNPGTVISRVGISPDGNRLVYFGASQIEAIDIAAKKQWFLGPTPSGTAGCQFSTNSQYVAYAAAVSQTNQIFLFNFLTGTSNLVSQSYLGAGGGNRNSDSPTISADGRHIAYRSAAVNLAPGATNGFPQIFVYDQVTGTNTLLSASLYGGQSANNFSLNPVFSGDGQTLVWQSWSGDLAGSDFNQSCNLFALEPFAINSVLPGQALGFSRLGLAPLSPTNAASPAATLAWPVAPGVSYQVLYKNNLTDPAWLTLTNPVSITGNQATLMDPAPNASQRFYELMAY